MLVVSWAAAVLLLLLVHLVHQLGDGSDAAAVACPCTASSDEPWAEPAGTGLLVETRFSPQVDFAVHHMLSALPASWVFVLIATPALRSSIFASLSGEICAGKVHAWEMASGSHGLTRVCPRRRSMYGSGIFQAAAAVPWREIRHVPQALPRWHHAMQLRDPRTRQRPWASGWWLSNDVQVAPETLATIPTERYLTFQPDGLLCGPTSAEQLSAYDSYDFVGAPWRGWTGNVGGNGGLSLRTRSVMLRIIDRFPYDNSNEDFFLSSRVTAVGGKLPPLDVAMAFSVETRFYPSPLAVHKPWMHLPKNLTAILVANCPVLVKILRFENITI